MKYRMISASALPLALGFAGNGVTLKKRGDSVEVELSAHAAGRIARHAAVRFEAIAEPAPEPASETPAPEHAEPLACADLTGVATTTETPPSEVTEAEPE